MLSALNMSAPRRKADIDAVPAPWPQHCNTATLLLATDAEDGYPQLTVMGPIGPWGKHTAATGGVTKKGPRLSPGPSILTAKC